MIPLGSKIYGIVGRVKETFMAPGGMLSPEASPATNFMPIDSPFISINGETRRSFVFGVSEYGGTDIIPSSSPQRIPQRYFNTIR